MSTKAAPKTQFITDDNGKKLSVVIPISEYERIIEELEDIKLYDEAKSHRSDAIPAKEAFRLLNAKRRKKI